LAENSKEIDQLNGRMNDSALTTSRRNYPTCRIQTARLSGAIANVMLASIQGRHLAHGMHVSFCRLLAGIAGDPACIFAIGSPCWFMHALAAIGISWPGVLNPAGGFLAIVRWWCPKSEVLQAAPLRKEFHRRGG